MKQQLISSFTIITLVHRILLSSTSTPCAPFLRKSLLLILLRIFVICCTDTSMSAAISVGTNRRRINMHTLRSDSVNCGEDIRCVNTGKWISSNCINAFHSASDTREALLAKEWKWDTSWLSSTRRSILHSWLSLGFTLHRRNCCCRLSICSHFFFLIDSMSF